MGDGAAPRPGWRQVALGEAASVVGGGTPRTAAAENFGGAIPWITPKDLSSQPSKYVSCGARFLTQRGYDTSAATMVPAGTVLLSSRAPVGLTAIAAAPVCTSQGCRSLIPNPSVVGGEFLYYLLAANVERPVRHADGTTFRELSAGTLRGLRFRIPPLPEQERIVEVLSAVDVFVDAQQRAAQSAWDYLCARYACTYRSVGCAVHVRVGDAVELVGGGTPSTGIERYWEPPTQPWATPGDLSGITVPVLTDTRRRLSCDGAAKVPGGVLPPGTFLMSSRAPVGYLAITRIPLAINQGFIAVRPGGAIHPLEMLCWAWSNMETIKARSGGSTFQEISKANFAQMTFGLPDREARHRFVDEAVVLLDVMGDRMQSAGEAARLRDYLRPGLVSGRLRVEDAECLVDDG